MKRGPRIKVLLLGALVALIAGGSVVWLTQERDSGMTVNLTMPPDDELRAFAASRVFFGHQSVGANVIGGVERAFSAGGTAGLLTVIETREPASTVGGFLAHAYVGVNGDPYGKLTDFKALLDGPLGSDLDIALLKFCYVDVVAETDIDAVFGAYASTVAALERSHPSVRFLYTTVPLTTDRGWKPTIKSWIGDNDHMGPADNLARQRYNELVRLRFGSTGRLFDIAAVEATLAQNPTERHTGSQVYYVLNQALAADPGHLNDLGAGLAATELIRVVAASSRER